MITKEGQTIPIGYCGYVYLVHPYGYDACYIHTVDDMFRWAVWYLEHTGDMEFVIKIFELIENDK